MPLVNCLDVSDSWASRLDILSHKHRAWSKVTVRRTKVSMLEQRKADHIRINLDQDVGFDQLTTGLERYRFIHHALPELNLADIDLSISFFGKPLRVPLLISSMTGGTERAHIINRTLATAAQEAGIAMGLGSMRAALEDSSLAESFRVVRPVAPDIFLFANLGAVQLNYGYTVDHCRRAVEMVEADALYLHFNVLQEALQPEGDTNFAGLLNKVEAVCKNLEVPVVAKEVGWGISEDTTRHLVDSGIAAIDVAGAGGTSWSQVEMYRADTESRRRVAATFRDWGIPTAESIHMVRRAAPQLPLIASGGLRNGLEIAKTIALGSHLAGMAGPFLRAAVVSTEAVLDTIEVTASELRATMFCIGAGSLDQLRDTPHLVRRT
jgi:isopentenyl-diphosphate delta-isomerase